MSRNRAFILIGIFSTIVVLLATVITYGRFQDPTPPQDVVILLERNMCFGSCPDYRLTIYGDGKVVYEGHSNVRVEGTRTSVIPKSKVREMVAEFDRIGFFALDDYYGGVMLDMSSTIISITLEGKTKTIAIYGGVALQEVFELANHIEEAVNSARWVGNQ